MTKEEKKRFKALKWQLKHFDLKLKYKYGAYMVKTSCWSIYSWTYTTSSLDDLVLKCNNFISTH